MALADTLTTREAVRRAALEDIVARCELASTSIEGGELDGIKVVSMGTLRDQVTGSLLVALPPPSEHVAEVSTPATVTVSAFCPECKLSVKIAVILTPELVVDASGAELKIKAKAKKAPHQHNQLSIDDLGDDVQVGMDELVIDDLRLRILTAVFDVCEAHVEADPPGPPSTLDAIAQKLELATEHERGDLEESLYAYSQLDEPLVEILSAPGSPVEYVLTEAGDALVDEAEDQDAGDDDADPDREDQERIDRDDP